MCLFGFGLGTPAVVMTSIKCSILYGSEYTLWAIECLLQIVETTSVRV